jgi:hypothetical protein
LASQLNTIITIFIGVTVVVEATFATFFYNGVRN